jgi:hypothetical protein
VRVTIDQRDPRQRVPTGSAFRRVDSGG